MDVTEKIKVGMKKQETESVCDANTAARVGSGLLPVYATPAMIALIEKAAAGLAEEQLPEGWTSVGIAMNVAHSSATPVGMGVRAEAEVTAVDGRKISYKVTAYDDAGEIGSGTHERFAVAKEKFMAKAQSKLS